MILFRAQQLFSSKTTEPDRLDGPYRIHVYKYLIDMADFKKWEGVKP